MIGEELKKMRKKQKLSQDDLAKLIFVSRQTISRWENNKTIPTTENILLLSSTFSLSVKSFFSKTYLSAEVSDDNKKKYMIRKVF